MSQGAAHVGCFKYTSKYEPEVLLDNRNHTSVHNHDQQRERGRSSHVSCKSCILSLVQPSADDHVCPLEDAREPVELLCGHQQVLVPENDPLQGEAGF